MRHLGIDYGNKRVGVALSDESGTMAFPHAVLKNDGQLMHNLEHIITQHAVAVIVIGHSKGNDGSDNPIHEQVSELVTDLTLATGLPIHLEPEQYSTQEALLWQGRNDKTDASAAAIILNSYLTRNQP